MEKLNLHLGYKFQMYFLYADCPIFYNCLTEILFLIILTLFTDFGRLQSFFY